MNRPLFLLAFAAATPASGDALLDQAFANGGAHQQADWAYYATTKVWTGGSTVVGDLYDRATSGARARPPLRESRIVSYDPSKPAGKREVVLRETGDHVRIDENGKDGGDLPAYAELPKLVQSNVRRVADSVATATYRFTMDPAQVKRFGSAKLEFDKDVKLPPLAGTLTVRKLGVGAPYVSSMVVALPAGQRGRGNAAGKVKQLSMGLSFAPVADGKVKLLRAIGFDTSLQGLGLVTVDFSILHRLENYRRVRQ